MWRSFLARPQGLLSRLRRPVDCSYGDTVVAAAALGGADGRILRRACASDAAGVHGAQSCPRPRRHLYVVLDEMNTGHSIYRLNVDDLDGGDEDAVAGIDRTAPAPLRTKPPPRRLPEPVLRLGYLSIGACAQFQALGSKIVATGYSHNGRITFVYDTKTGRLDIGKTPPKRLNFSYYHAAATGNKLYTFDSDGSKPHYLCAQSALGEYDGYDSGHDMKVLSMRGQTMKWAWKTAPTRLPNPNSRHYDRSFVGSYAVHPDGRTIFVSCFVYPTDSKPKRHFTFSIDTEGHESAHRGDWSMPFGGQAHYDPDLDSWVGLRKADGTDGGRLGNLYFCSCDVPDLSGAEGPVEAPAWKMCKEKLMFLKTLDSYQCHALVHTGRGRFCLVEVMPVPDKKIGKCLLLVTMFRAKHGKNGELIATPCRPGHSYLLPNRSVGSPSAFWL